MSDRAIKKVLEWGMPLVTQMSQCLMCDKKYWPGDQDLCDDCLHARTQMMEDQNGERV